MSSIISNFEIRNLFGVFSYRIPYERNLDNPAILYGENGVGKSTILNLIFHLLSSSNNRGIELRFGILNLSIFPLI